MDRTEPILSWIGFDLDRANGLDRIGAGSNAVQKRIVFVVALRLYVSFLHKFRTCHCFLHRKSFFAAETFLLHALSRVLFILFRTESDSGLSLRVVVSEPDRIEFYLKKSDWIRSLKYRSPLISGAYACSSTRAVSDTRTQYKQLLLRCLLKNYTQ